MLQRRFRLPATISLNNPKNIHTPYVVCKVSSNKLSYNRYGFIVSKQVDKRATKRNETKRKVRSCIETKQAQIKSGYDMLVIIKQQAVEAPISEICHTLYKAMAKEQLL